jgi:hypothetical protein
MPAALKKQVEEAFLQSLRHVWIAMACLAGLGLCSLIFIKDIPLRRVTDKKWDSVGEKEVPPTGSAMADAGVPELKSV